MIQMKKILGFIHLSACLATSTLMAAAPPAQAQAGNPCGSLENNYGPYDYRGKEGSKRLVETNHFTYGVEHLTTRLTGAFGSDIAYTLRAFPNHYRALLSMERLAEKEKADPPEGANISVECYYERAMRFLPDDHVVRLLYANFLIKKSRRGDAMKQIDYVADTTRDNPIAQLNAGRLYLDLKEYDRALSQAYQLISMGVDRPELRDGLTAAGRWIEPAASSPASGAASAAASGAQ